MQNEEKSRLEQRIIQYFDGSLNGEESRSLLADVGKSTEARALFKSHESLERLIAASRTPMEMPMEAKRSIADRIPGLLAFIPGLLGGAEALPVISQSANPFIAFLSKIPLSTAISVGTSAVVLTTAGVIIKNKLDDNAASNPKAKVAVVQSHVAAPNAQIYAELPKFAASSQALQRTEGTKGTQKTAANAANASVANTSIEKSNIALNNTSIESNDIPVASTPSAASQSADVSPSAPSINITASPRPVPGVNADIPVIGGSIMTPFPEEDNEGITIRPYASTGDRFVQISRINGGSYFLGVPNYLFGLNFELGDRYAFRVQGGSSSFAQVSSVETQKLAAFGSIPIYQSIVVAQPAYWATLGISYSLAVTESLPLILSADGGAAFTGKTGVMGILGASTEIPLTSQMALRPMLTYDAVRTSIQVPSGNAIYENPINQTSMWSRAFGLQINLMYRF